MINLVFGIILDTFGALRDEKADIDEDITSKCFICGIEADRFQRLAKGFKNHTKNDHNLWKYLFFFIYLDEKEETEYTAIEQFIVEMKTKGKIDFFPIDTAICLTSGVSKKKKKKKSNK